VVNNKYFVYYYNNILKTTLYHRCITSYFIKAFEITLQVV